MVKEKWDKCEVQRTDDGSSTIWLKDMDEHYHSVKGALTESCHIYRDGAFLHRHDGTPLRLLEVGFGTGLNAAVTAMASRMDCPVHYFSVEKYPVESTLLGALAYDKALQDEVWQFIIQASWNEPVKILPTFILEKLHADFLTMHLPEKLDVVYYDAFAPEKQPEMWSKDIFERLYAVMNNGAVLTTYCAKGVVRRMLQDVGFTVERIPGPPGGKREVLRATKKEEETSVRSLPPLCD